MPRKLKVAIDANRLDDVIKKYAVDQLKQTTDAEVVEGLKEQGINSLEDLVHNVLDYYRSIDALEPRRAGKDTFIYEQLVYKKEIPVNTAEFRYFLEKNFMQ